MGKSQIRHPEAPTRSVGLEGPMHVILRGSGFALAPQDDGEKDDSPCPSSFEARASPSHLRMTEKWRDKLAQFFEAVLHPTPRRIEPHLRLGVIGAARRQNGD